MAVGTIEYFSECLRRSAMFRVILPNEGDVAAQNPAPMRTLLLLHGYCGGSGDWLWNSNIMDLAQRYHMCVLLPTGENSFYLDGRATGRKYATHVGQELISYARKTFGLSERREDTFVGGYSMGGYGALHTALQFPETFSGAMALSSALIWKGIKELRPGEDNGVANYEYYRLMFGEAGSPEEENADLEELIRKLEERGTETPRLYLACGAQDFLIEPNRSFADFLKGRRVDYSYREGDGEHNFVYWNRHLEPGIRWMLGEV